MLERVEKDYSVHQDLPDEWTVEKTNNSSVKMRLTIKFFCYFPDKRRKARDGNTKRS
ncbi:MAG: hypothetical protein JWR87_919 [Segetibacter sp.]|jgi:hypothetical protein|nr:hypothetical protein [Segetibacter sp.]